MGRGELPVPGTPLRTPGTPGNGTDFDGMLGLSPTVALASKSQRSGKTFTEVYTDYVRLQEEYAKKCAEHDQMDRTLTAVLAEIEERAPLLTQQRIEYERVTAEATELSAQLSHALADREAQAKLAETQTQKLVKSTRENALLQQQLSDLGRQVQTLLKEIARRDDPTIPTDEEMESVPFVPANDVNTIITNNLVLFRSIESLQEQNQKLLRITRELGEKMEAEEKEYKAAMEQEQAEAIREAHEAMQELAAQLETQKKNSDTLIQSYVKERDALKAMLSRAEAAASRAGISIDVGQAPPSAETSAPVMPDSEVARELAEVQQQFDAYRTEMGHDATRLRDELTSAQREVHELTTSLAKANAKIEYLNERHRVHAEQYQLTSRDLEEITKRNQALFDQWTRADVECSRLSEDLHVANARLEQLRNESANLRAEKQIWEGVQARLLDENKTLAMERSHLSDLMANIQKMHNDLERSGENDRRRLENQLQMLEAQSQDLRTQLSRERDSLRHVTTQKDLESKDLQSRLDKANLELSKTRETLLHGLEEKLGVYEGRPSTAIAAPAPSVDPNMSREQQLEQEVAELRSALKVAEVDLASAKGHVEQFKEISQANEVALANLNSTFDEYKSSTESQIARQEAEYKALEAKLEAASAELARLREQYNASQKAFEEERTALKNDKKILEDTIVDMTTSEKHLESDRSSREQEIKLVEERAKAAEERYSKEVVAHAESIKTIEQLRRDLSDAQNKARENQAASETAVAKLAASEQSWKQQKETLDKEISDLNARCQDLSSQNTLLHQHLESVSSQAARIRQAANDSASTPATEGDGSEDAAKELENLRPVVSYLRKEKEIVELQLELGKQENARLKSQIEHLSQSLEEARTTISEERERAVQSAASAAQHAELVEKMQQINVLRESNSLLRAECSSNAKKASDLETKLAQLSAEVEPAKEQARVAQAELEAAKGQVQRLEQESRGWQERNSRLLSKYQRVDASEVQALKEEVEKLKAEIEEHAVAKKKAEDAVKKSSDNVERLNNAIEMQRKRLIEERNESRATIAKLEAKIATLSSQDEIKNLQQSVATLQTEKATLLAEKEALEKAASAAVPAAASSAPAPNWEAEKAEIIKARDEAVQQIKELVEEKRGLKMQNENFQKRLADTTKLRRADQERHVVAVEKAVEQTKTEMQVAKEQEIKAMEKQHAEALESLRKELEAKQRAEIKPDPQATVKSEPADQQAAIEAALAAERASFEQQINSARDSGRKEAEMKLRVVQKQCEKAKRRVKDLEQNIHEWEASGLLPAGSLASIPPPVVPDAKAVASSAPPPATPAAPTETQPAAKPEAKPATAAQPTQTPPATTAAAQNTPAAKPAAPVRSQPAPKPAAPATIQGQRPATTAAATTAAAGAPVRRQAPAGAAPRGGAAVRGRGVPLGRVAPSRPLPTKPAAPGGLSIAGAAAAAAASTAGPKRPRDESDNTGQSDSLAKRLKPADGTPATGATPTTSTKPVQLRRPPPGT
ncbi:hypothetical protein CC2G_013002 [Coprinopsis cinerea AmutBmut pab1-1]|nr:hypothetical protein CC2G_013002 [Coprinopsis cinerea AmutBmut pab1-1]